jgi:hypothetical protein
MLNLEYARIVEQDRRREIAARIRIERALHPEEPVTETRPASNVGLRRGIQAARSSTTPAR